MDRDEIDIREAELAKALAARDALARARRELDEMLEVLRGASADLQGAVIDLREAALTLQGATLMAHPDVAELRSTAAIVEAGESGARPNEEL